MLCCSPRYPPIADRSISIFLAVLMAVGSFSMVWFLTKVNFTNQLKLVIASGTYVYTFTL